MMTGNNYQVNGWTNFGDISPEHGQLWIKDAYPDNTQDFAECVEVIGSGDFDGLADNQYIIERGIIHIPIDDPDKVASALDVIGVTPSLATWIDLAIAFNACHGMDRDILNGFEIVQIGKTRDDTYTRPGSNMWQADVILHGNASIEKYLRDNALA